MNAVDKWGLGIVVVVIVLGALLACFQRDTERNARRHLERVAALHATYCPECGKRFPYEWADATVTRVVEGKKPNN